MRQSGAPRAIDPQADSDHPASLTDDANPASASVVQDAFSPLVPGSKEGWLDSLRLACGWITERSMMTDAAIDPAQNPGNYPYADWRHSCREYDAREKTWAVFGPLWHTGQAVRALVLAHRLIGDPALLEQARRGAAFILRAQRSDPDDAERGLIVACENHDPKVSATSCMLECLGGLIALGEHTGEARYTDAALAAVNWAVDRMFLPDEGLFLDNFRLDTHQPEVAPNTQRYGVPGRPLNEDAVLLWASEISGSARLHDAFFAVADRLLRDESPAGNWLNYPPCHPDKGMIHPRQAYWWGRPMLAAWKTSGEERYLACALRCADWYAHAQRRDGAIFRETYTDFTTTSFGHATSGAQCAALFWCDLIRAGVGDPYREHLQRALDHGRAMQFVNPSDPNLRGAVLEKVMPPDGTDRSPYLVRDLGTIFYIQAVAEAFQSDMAPNVARNKGGKCKP